MTTTKTSQLSYGPHFNRQEFLCHCCGAEGVQQPLLDALNAFRQQLNRAVFVNSGYRCAKHNAAVGGAKESYHVRGMAADIRVAGLTPEQVAAAAEKFAPFANGGIGLYPRWVHVDAGPRRRWQRR